MKLLAAAVGLALLFLPETTSSRDQAQLVLQSAQLPMFPQIARTANIAGQVEASLTVDADGNVTSVDRSSIVGHRNREIYSLLEILRPGDPSLVPWKDHSTFVYKLVRGLPDTLAVKMRSYRYIEIDAPVVTLD